MRTWRVRITGTINDEVEVVSSDAGLPDDATDEEVVAAALEAWRYVEYEDLDGQVDQAA